MCLFHLLETNGQSKEASGFGGLQALVGILALPFTRCGICAPYLISLRFHIPSVNWDNDTHIFVVRSKCALAHEESIINVNSLHSLYRPSKMCSLFTPTSWFKGEENEVPSPSKSASEPGLGDSHSSALSPAQCYLSISILSTLFALLFILYYSLKEDVFS